MKEKDLEFELISNAVITNLLVKDMLLLKHSIQYGKLSPEQMRNAINAYSLEACVLESRFMPDNPHLMPESLNIINELLNPESLTVISPQSPNIN